MFVTKSHNARAAEWAGVKKRKRESIFEKDLKLTYTILRKQKLRTRTESATGRLRDLSEYMYDCSLEVGYWWTSEDKLASPDTWIIKSTRGHVASINSKFANFR